MRPLNARTLMNTTVSSSLNLIAQRELLDLLVLLVEVDFKAQSSEREKCKGEEIEE